MISPVMKVLAVVSLGLVVVACGDEESGEASQSVKDCVAARQAAAEQMGLPDEGVAELLEECEAEARLGLPAATPLNDRACAAERKVLEIALETYYANGGSPPVDESRLIQEGLLRTDLPGFSIVGDAVVADPDARCA